MFNNEILVVPVGICFIIGILGYDRMMEINGYKISEDKRYIYGVWFMLLYSLTLLSMVSCTQTMKYSIRRERP